MARPPCGFVVGDLFQYKGEGQYVYKIEKVDGLGRAIKVSWDNRYDGRRRTSFAPEGHFRADFSYSVTRAPKKKRKVM